MLVTGNLLRAKLQALALMITLGEGEFNETLKRFPDETKDPEGLAKSLFDRERQMAKLQAAQAAYNLSVEVTVNGERMPLVYWIKLIGGASRAAKRWRDAMPRKRDRLYGEEFAVRSKDEVSQEYTLTRLRVNQLAAESAGYVSEIQAAIASANAQELIIDWLTADDLVV